VLAELDGEANGIPPFGDGDWLMLDNNH